MTSPVGLALMVAGATDIVVALHVIRRLMASSPQRGLVVGVLVVTGVAMLGGGAWLVLGTRGA